MDVQPYTIDNEAEAKTYLIALLGKPEFQSMDVIKQRSAALIMDPAIKAYFLTTGAEMLDGLRGRP